MTRSGEAALKLNPNPSIRASGHVTGGEGDQVSDSTGSKITADGDRSHEFKRRLLPGRKAMTNLDSILKSRDVTLPTTVYLVKAMVWMDVRVGL